MEGLFMRSPEEIKKEFTHSWLCKAEEDFRTSMHLAKAGMNFAYGAVFHAQQAVEKYLKACLVWEQIEFPKTHDIAALLLLISHRQTDLAKVLADAANLTPYGVTYRYPGDYPHVEPEDVKKALEIAERVRHKIKDCLPEEAWNEEV
jgi:HEPN domain-containing protein